MAIYYSMRLASMASDSTTTSAATWGAWTSQACGGTTAALAGVWYSWNPTDASTTTSAADAWGYWYQLHNQPSQPSYGGQMMGSWQPETDEERATRLERHRQEAAEHKRRAEEAAKKKAEADARALELLEDLMSEKEMAVYKKTGRVVVKGRQHTYLIRRDSGNVAIIVDKGIIDCCMHIDDHHAFSRHDNVISMKLFLQAREEKFLAEANRHGNRRLEGADLEALQAVVNG